MKKKIILTQEKVEKEERRNKYQVDKVRGAKW